MSGQHSADNRGSSNSGKFDASGRGARQESKPDIEIARFLDSLHILPGRPGYRPDILARAGIKENTVRNVAVKRGFLGFKHLAALESLGEDVRPDHLELLHPDIAKDVLILLARRQGETELEALVEENKHSGLTIRRLVLEKNKASVGLADVKAFMYYFDIKVPKLFARVLRGDEHLTFKRLLTFAKDSDDLTIAEAACLADDKTKTLLLKLGRLYREQEKSASPVSEDFTKETLSPAPGIDIKYRNEALEFILKKTVQFRDRLFAIGVFLALTSEQFEAKMTGKDNFTLSEVSRLQAVCPKLPPLLAAALLRAEDAGEFLATAPRLVSRQRKVKPPKVTLPDWLEAFEKDPKLLVEERKRVLEKVKSEHKDSLGTRKLLAEWLGIKPIYLTSVVAINKAGNLKGSINPEKARRLEELGISGREIIVLIAPAKWKKHLDLISEEGV